MVDSLYPYIRTYAHAEIKKTFEVEKTFMAEATKAIGSTETGIALVLDQPAPLQNGELEVEFKADVIVQLSKAVPQLQSALRNAKITVPSNPERLLLVMQTGLLEGGAVAAVEALTKAIAPTWSVQQSESWSYCGAAATAELERAFEAREETADLKVGEVKYHVKFDYTSKSGRHPTERLDKEVGLHPDVKRRGQLRVRTQGRVITGASVASTLPSFLKVFELYDVDIGKHPPLFTGVAHYDADNIGEQIILDFDVVWCSNIRGGLRAGISDWLSTSVSFGNVSFRGTLRVVLSPLVEVLPCFGNLEVSFVTAPDISFDLFVGDFPILGLPFLSATVDWFVQQQVATTMLEPTRIRTEILSKEDMKTGMPKVGFGILRLELISAQNLRNADFLGKSDPMVVMMLHHEPPVTQESKCINNTLNPKWNEHFEYIVDFRDAMFSFNIYDIDTKIGGGVSKRLGGNGTNKKFLGQCELMLTDLTDNQPEERVMTLRRKQQDVGSVKFMMELKPFTDATDPAILDPELRPPGSLGVFSVTIKYLQDLPLKAAKIKCTVGSTSFVRSIKDDKHLSKRMTFLVRHLHNEKLVLVVQKPGGDGLGRIEIPCARMLDRDDRLLELFSLDAAVTGKVMLELSLRTVQHASKPVRKHLEGLSQIGVVRCRLLSAQQLPNIERFSKSDPFVDMTINQNGHSQTQRSTYKNNDLNPVWNEHFEFVVSTLQDTLHFIVQDYGNNTFRDSVLGECQFNLLQLKDRANILVEREFDLSHPSKPDKGAGTLTVELEYKPFLKENLDANAYDESHWSSGVAFLNITDLDNTPFADPVFSVEGGINGEVNPAINVPFHVSIHNFSGSLKITASDRNLSALKKGLKGLTKGLSTGLGAAKGLIPRMSGKDQQPRLSGGDFEGPGTTSTGVCQKRFKDMLPFASEPSQFRCKLNGLTSGEVTVAMIMRTVTPGRTGRIGPEVHLGKKGDARRSAFALSEEGSARQSLEAAPPPSGEPSVGREELLEVRLEEDKLGQTPEEAEEEELKAPWVPSGPGTLTIEVVKCENLPAATNDSQASPYVSIRLKSRSTHKVYKDKTQTKKLTRNPLYGQSGGQTVFKIAGGLVDYEIDVVVKHHGTFRKDFLARCDPAIEMTDETPINPSNATALDFGVEPPGPARTTVPPIGQTCKYRLAPSGFVYLKVIDFEADQERAKVRADFGGERELDYDQDFADLSYATTVSSSTIAGSSPGNTPERGPRTMKKKDSNLSLI